MAGRQRTNFLKLGVSNILPVQTLNFLHLDTTKKKRENQYAMDNTNSLCAAEAGQNFVDWFYTQLNSAKPISSAYTTNNEPYKSFSSPLPSSSSPTVGIKSDICLNGRVISSPEELETQLSSSKQFPKCPADKTVRYAVESFDTTVVNGDYRVACPENLLEIHGKDDGVRMMISLNVSGTVYYGVDKLPKENNESYVVRKHFNDHFLLVPNWDVIGRQNKNKNFVGRRYIIASHIHRAFDD
ncbi:hypothetical protein QBC38DRAFT_471039 [Podospora fimiseda]|uniref:NTF2 domain-containing protein n=1 Tax=Podospora fimiseda TaxID=252190 RepID=A0AAN7BUK0_9PEZI|nr:hypothetical protein QBC38DRAFT_471039 [Podospora fimiseda]